MPVTQFYTQQQNIYSELAVSACVRQSSCSSRSRFRDFIGEVRVAFIELDDAQPGLFGEVLLTRQELLASALQSGGNDLFPIDAASTGGLQPSKLAFGEIALSLAYFTAAISYARLSRTAIR